MNNMNLEQLLAITHQRLFSVLDTYIQNNTTPLHEAMYYSLENGGKRIRPLLVYATGLALGTDIKNLDAAAAAIELIHSYSLVHDDLPAMDNADMRRGKPSCHKTFGEAMAILAGDALQPLAFQILSEHPSALTDQQRLKMISALSIAAGVAGMAGGQALDMQKTEDLETLIKLHQLKTGALIRCAVQLGAISAHASLDTMKSLIKYADDLGLAFQIQDDVLDLTSHAAELGKPAGLDRANEKLTFPDFLGIENSQKKAWELFESAKIHLSALSLEHGILAEIVDFIKERKK